MRVEWSDATLQTEAPGPFVVRCFMALRACEPAHPHHTDAEDDYPRLIFHHHFEPKASLSKKALQIADLVALFTA